MIETVYRCDQSHDESESVVYFTEYEVIRETENSVYIITGGLHNGKYGTDRRVTKDPNAKLPFAFLTKEAALNSYIHRKRRHVSILRWQLKLAEATLKTCRIMYDESNIHQVGDKTINHYDL